MRLILRASLVSWIGFGLSQLLLGDTSRRMVRRSADSNGMSVSLLLLQVNATYIFWTLATNTLLLLLFCILTASTVQRQHSTYLQVGNIRRAVNNHGLFYFLISNLATGAVNLAIRTLDYRPVPAFVVLCLYMLATCGSAVLADVHSDRNQSQ